MGTLATALPWSPRGVSAATPAKVHRIGVLDPDPDAHVSWWKEFVAELARRGYVEGHNLVFERRFGSELRPELVNKLAAELVALKVDVIYAAHGTLSALAAKNATRTIPIVFFSSGDPVGMGLVASLGQPGGNLTGNSILGTATIPKALQFLAEAVGRLTRIVDIQPRGTRSLPWFERTNAELTAAARQLGAKYDYVDVDSIDEIDPVLNRLVREGVDAVSLDSYPLFRPHLEWIAAAFVAHGLPSIGDARAGFLLHYQPNRLHLARKAAECVDRILRGAKPSELPVVQASTFELVVNLKTAKALGLKIPQSLLLRADEVLR